jgi:hypothetical protein
MEGRARGRSVALGNATGFSPSMEYRGSLDPERLEKMRESQKEKQEKKVNNSTFSLASSPEFCE